MLLENRTTISSVRGVRNFTIKIKLIPDFNFGFRSLVIEVSLRFLSTQLSFWEQQQIFKTRVTYNSSCITRYVPHIPTSTSFLGGNPEARASRANSHMPLDVLLTPSSSVDLWLLTNSSNCWITNHVSYLQNSCAFQINYLVIFKFIQLVKTGGVTDIGWLSG